MKNIFQTGLALGIPSGSCSCLNMDFEWLYANPINLLWMDKLVITQSMWDIVINERCTDNRFEGKKEVFAKSTKLIYTILNEVGLVNIIPDSCINKETAEDIFNQISSDLELLGKKENTDHPLITIGDHCHCVPSLWTLYASLYLSRQNNASFMLSPREISYLKTIIPLKMQNVFTTPRIARRSTAINEVLQLTLPNFELGHDYLTTSMKRCNNCNNNTQCKDSYLSQIEKQTLYILEYREHEEINQLCELMDRICSEKFMYNEDIPVDELLHEINIERIKVQRKLNHTYKKFERWRNIVLTFSAGMTLGNFFSYPKIAAVGSAGVLATTIADKLFTTTQKKYKWINLFNK